ncbi:putative transposase-like protein [Nephila pilipes]|uniref:Putative transposase-like protein n=1 Tax=Nephila pilipes TaxID=299642 RepID=A0A8X6N9B4_NEPPI|nr:putative transposase-like protein [Nephila pilipes]
MEFIWNIFQSCADWRNYVFGVIIDFIVINIEKMEERVKKQTTGIDESKIGKRKYNRGHLVEGQWVFDGVEHDSGHCFIVAVHGRLEKILPSLIGLWIESGTTAISDY